MDLGWILDNKTIPHEVTDSLRKIADKYRFTADQMNQHKLEIINELEISDKGYIVKFLFPHGYFYNEIWHHALIRMEIRRLQELL